MPYQYDIHELQHQVAVYEDEEAYRKLFFSLFPSLQNFAYSILKSRVNSEEIVSDVFIHIWERRSHLMEIKNLRLYLFVAVKNGVLRKLQQDKHEIQQVPLNDLHVEFISDYTSVEEMLQYSETEKMMYNAVQQLPPRCKMIFKLAKEDHLKYKEIASLLNISIKTIDKQLAIALRKISLSFQKKQLKK